MLYFKSIQLSHHSVPMKSNILAPYWPERESNPNQKKVQAILALNPPNNVRELRHFLGIVQYYREMWAKCCEMLAPLNDLVGECSKTKTTKRNKTKRKPLQWDLIHQQAIDNIKAAIAKEVVLAYPGFSKSFEIYTDASSILLGAVIAQDNRSIAFFSRNLSKNAAEIQHDWNWTLGHSGNTKGVQGNAVGAVYQGFH